MALKKTVNFAGIDVVGAYHRIEAVRTSGKTMIVADVKSYADPSTGMAFESMQIACPYDLSSANNAFAQAYNHLKSLPLFSGAEDC